jgi:hypothetical protein
MLDWILEYLIPFAALGGGAVLTILAVIIAAAMWSLAIGRVRR